MVKHDDILQALSDRKTWETRQGTWYQMRHDGLRRRNKPWPNAADMHFPLADMLIEKLKPFYVGQIFAGDTIAAFVARSQEAAPFQNAASQWFDYQLKQCSNFEEEIEIAADRMLQSGRAVVKVYWDASRKELVFEAVDPLYLIVPASTGRFVEPDWIVHVQHYSKAAYRLLKDKGFDTSEETLQRICGGDTEISQVESEKYQREGLTKPKTKDQIVVWEVFCRNTDNGQWTVRTYSPTNPRLALRPAFVLPYNRGVFAGNRPPPPFFDLSCEKKDRGFYDSRGVCERVGAFEASISKDWNTQKDYQTLTCSPVFYAENGVPNGANLRMVPGQILPFQLQAVTMPPLPMDLANSMMSARSTAEQLIGIPDFGTNQQNAQGERKTAREVSLIANVMGQNVDLRARRFRRELAHGLNLAWSILQQYAAEALKFYYLDELKDLPPQALAAEYRIEPNGSGDNYNRALVLQKAEARYGKFNGDPMINQEELRRSVLDADDPRLTKRLLLNAGSQNAMQQEDQAQEITIMLLGFPAEVRQTDDHALHLQSIKGFIDRRIQLQEPLGPEMCRLLAQHATQHAQALQKTNKQLWAQHGPAIQQMVAELTQAGQADQMQMAPGGAPMGGAM